mmetsp:Transcript_75613/g.180647  ORF Transcript_75613/g.180647 Transcript_75613/m.180647 type:complete len:244 (-) Transcript_75613:1767-2498(-)
MDVAKAVDDGVELFLRIRLTLRKGAAANGLEHGLQAVVDGVVALLGLCGNAPDLVLQAPEDEHRVLAALLANFNVGAVHGAHDEAPIHHELHVGGAAGFRAGRGDVLGDVGGRDHHLGRGDAVVGHEGALQVGCSVRVRVDDLRHVADELDDDLCVDVGRRRLAANQHHPLLVGLALAGGLALELEVAVDDKQNVHQLSLVLVDSLDLDVDQSVLVDVQVHGLLEPGCQLRLAARLHGQPLGV